MGFLRTYKLLIIFVAIIFLLVACGNGEEESSSEADPDIQTEEDVAIEDGSTEPDHSPEPDYYDEIEEDEDWPFGDTSITGTLGFSQEEVDNMNADTVKNYRDQVFALQEAAIGSEHQYPDVFFGEVDASYEAIEEMDENEWARHPVGLIAVTSANRSNDTLELSIALRYINPYYEYKGGTYMEARVYDDHGNEYYRTNRTKPNMLSKDFSPVGYTVVERIVIEIPEAAPIETLEIEFNTSLRTIDWPIDENTGLPKTVDIGAPEEWAENFYGNVLWEAGETKTIKDFIEVTLEKTKRFSFINSDRVLPYVEWSVSNTDYNPRDIHLNSVYVQLSNGNIVPTTLQYSDYVNDEDRCRIEGNDDLLGGGKEWSDCSRAWGDAELTLEGQEEGSIIHTLRLWPLDDQRVSNRHVPEIFYDPEDLAGLWISFRETEEVFWVPLDLSEEYEVG